ncbi:MAG TPA: hypothetical protein VND68_13705 [Chloroflexia bacterium]|jgi:uncharacterized membrane protein YozB (DUF420 family)|nr:hypothetical protein [Chloroflexia bacterium]
MDISDVIFSTLTYFASYLPVLAVWIAGFVLALLNRHKHPRLSKLALISFGTFLVLALVSSFMNVLTVAEISQTGRPEQLSQGFYIFRVVHAFVSTGAWIVLLVALFRGRTEAETGHQAPTP